MDLIPETTWKVCDAPNLYFFERNGARGFADLLDPVDARIVDWADSMVQGIDILHRLGFRTVYLAGCEMRIRPAPRQVELAARAGVECGFSARPDRCDMRMTLGEFVAACARQGLGEKELEACGEMEAYHFDERKPLRALIQTDAHYFRIVQALRLSRRCLALHGLRLISATPGSRLNDHFPYEPAESILDRIRRSIGDPRSEATRGRYALSEAWLPEAVGPMRDIRPHNWGACGPPTARRGADGERGEAVALEAHGPVREVG